MKGLTGSKGSRISPTVGSKIKPVSVKLRERKDTVNNDLYGKEIRSSSTAVTFVIGSIANRRRFWKLKEGKSSHSMKET